MQNRSKFTSRYSGTFYFFPAFLPFIEVAPLLLGLLGGVTGAAKIFTPSFWQKYKMAFLAVFVLCLASFIAVYIYRLPNKETAMAGTRAIPEKEYSTPVYFATAQKPLPVNLRQFGEIWSVETKTQVFSTPLIAGGVLVYGAYGNSVEAVSLADGQRVWSLPHNAPVLSLGSEGDIIYSGEGLHYDQSSSVSAINAEDGRIIWRREFLGHIEESATPDRKHNMVWVGTGPGGIWALDARTGHVRWHQALGHIDSKPLLNDDILYMPAQSDENVHITAFHALDAKNGKTVWKIPQKGQPWGSPVIDETKKIIFTSTGIGQIGVNKGTDQGWAQAVSTEGKLLWEVVLPTTPIAPAVYIPQSDLVIYTAKNGDVLALRVKDGSTAWHEKAGEELHAPAVLINGFDIPMIATTSYEGIFSIRNALTGQELVRRQVGSGVNSSPVVGDDMVYVASAYKITAYAGVHSLGIRGQ